MSPDLVDLVSVCKSAGWLPKICCMDKNFAFGSTDLFKKKKILILLIVNSLLCFKKWKGCDCTLKSN